MIWDKEQIRHIRNLYKNGMSLDELSVRFRLSRAVLTDILCPTGKDEDDEEDQMGISVVS